MATTVKDIAIAAGVSKAAVSKVLHNSSTSVRVSEDRAAKIRQLAQDMGYVPNANARTLRTRRNETIGVYFEDLAGIASGPLYTTHLLDGICRVLFQKHYRATLVAELDHEDTAGTLGDGRLDGVIWCRVIRDDPTMSLMQKSPIPIVALNATPAPGNGNVLYVRCDNAGGMELAVEHLWNLGHRKVLFLRETREVMASDCVDRLAGFSDALKRRGVSVEAEDVAAWDWNMDSFDGWWATQPLHTAVIAWSESCAGRLLKKCASVGVSIPSELSVIGFDSTQFCDTTKPPLTAVRQPIIEMGSLAAELILEVLDGVQRDKQTCYTLPCPLDLRESTAEPRR